MKKRRIKWDRIAILAAGLLVIFLVLGLLGKLIFTPRLPQELKGKNRNAEKITEIEKQYIVAAYYPKNITNDVKATIDQEIATFKLANKDADNAKKEILYIDYTAKEGKDFKSYGFFKATGNDPKNLTQVELARKVLDAENREVTLDTLFINNYLEQLGGLAQNKLPKENRNGLEFMKATRGTAANFANFTVDDDKIIFHMDASRLYQGQEGNVDLEITFREMSYFLSREIAGVKASEVNDNVVRYIDVEKPMICFTYDDGPYTSVTQSILDTMEKYHSVATFFVVGKRVGNGYDINLDKYPMGCVERAISLGCEIGNHTNSHEYDLTTLSQQGILDEVLPTEEAVKRIVPDYVMRSLRPTGGAYNSDVKAVVPYVMYNWSVDTKDWSTRDAEETYNHVMQYIEDGDIVLMHDLYPSTAEATARLVPELIEKGYQFVTVSELMEYKGIQTENGQVYTCSYRGAR